MLWMEVLVLQQIRVIKSSYNQTGWFCSTPKCHHSRLSHLPPVETQMQKFVEYCYKLKLKYKLPKLSLSISKLKRSAFNIQNIIIPDLHTYPLQKHKRRSLLNTTKSSSLNINYQSCLSPFQN